jgi:hypothetical protein
MRIKEFALLLTAALAACAGVRWERPNTDATQLRGDTDQCMLQARERYARMTGPIGGPRLDPRFGPDVNQPSPAERRIEEEQMADRCMREKGYRLVPADK